MLRRDLNGNFPYRDEEAIEVVWEPCSYSQTSLEEIDDGKSSIFSNKVYELEPDSRLIVFKTVLVPFLIHLFVMSETGQDSEEPMFYVFKRPT